MQLGEQIKFIRQKTFMSQELFANELNVSVSSINRWETGKARPNLAAMKQIKVFCNTNNLPFEDIEKEWFETK